MPASWRALGAGFASVGTFPDGLGDGAGVRRHRVCRLGRRAEPLSEQLDSRQGLRHGAVRPAPGESDHRRRRGHQRDRDELHLRADAGEHAAMAQLVAIRQPRAGAELRPGHGRDHRADVADGLRDALRPAGPAQRRLVPAPGGAAAARERRPVVRRAVPGASAPSRCSARPWASSTTPAAWRPTS